MYKVSIYKNITNTKSSETTTIEEYLKTVKEGLYKKKIEKLRMATAKKEQRELKQALANITASGVFSPSRNDEHLIEHSGLIQVDIDSDKNKSIIAEDCKKKLIKDPYSFAVFISPTGTGVKVLVRIEPSLHNVIYEQLENYYKSNYGLNIDTTCRNVSRPMFVSYDPELYLNPESKIFSFNGEHKKQKPFNNSKSVEVEKLIELIEAAGTDITGNYETWRKIGFALASEFGTAGEEYFHRISHFYAGYSREECSKQYKACCKGNKGGISLNSLFYVAKEHGIILHEKGILNGSLVNGKNNRPPVDQRPAPEKVEQPSIQSTNNLPLLVRVENFLRNRYEFRRNVVNEKVEYREKGTLVWNEAKAENISRKLQHNHFNFSANRMASLLASDFVKEYNPFIKYFNSLQYDPKTEPSYIEKLCSYIHAKDQKRFNWQFKKMLVRCIACSTTNEKSNHNFNKHVLVLINRNQSIGKSSFCRWLCPPALQEYFVENIAMDKDGQIALATSFLINLDELASLSKYDINQLKAKISMASINIRLPYGRNSQQYPRRANFIGSTNNDEFLTDDTGNVRWLCFEIDDFTHGFWEAESPNYIDINKVWSEANYLFDDGFQYQLSSTEIAENENANRQYEVESLEQQMILEHFEIDPEKQKENFMTASKIFSFLLSKGLPAQKINERKIGSVLKKLGFIQGTVRIENNPYPVKGYFLKFRQI